MLAIANISTQTGCATMSAIRVATFGSQLDKRVASLEGDEQAVKNSALPEEKKKELLDEIEWKKRVIGAYFSYITRTEGVDKDLQEPKSTTQRKISGEISKRLNDIRLAPLRTMLTEEEDAELVEALRSIEEAKTILADKNLEERAENQLSMDKSLDPKVFEWSAGGFSHYTNEHYTNEHLIRVQNLIDSREKNIKEKEGWSKEEKDPEKVAQLTKAIAEEKRLLQQLQVIADNLQAKSKRWNAISQEKNGHYKLESLKNLATSRGREFWDDFVFVRTKQ
jgi:hypothetical protein